MDAIYKRRSIRKYQTKSVPEENLLQFIKAGMNAPSAGNQRPWQFLIITERKVAVGYPAEEKPPKNEFEKSRIRYSRW